MVIEVFKTNVKGADDARRLVEELQRRLVGCSANFDLEDCDHILRVVGPAPVTAVVSTLSAFGFHAEVLSDDIPELLQF